MRNCFVYIVISFISFFLFSSCGTQKAVSSSMPSKTSGTSDISSTGVPVQTTFFGASFGDKGPFNVKRTMEWNGVSDTWQVFEKSKWVTPDVEFAGNVWFATIISFSDDMFSRIIFTDKVNARDDGLELYMKLYELLLKKYPLVKDSSSALGEDFYIYFDSEGNSVGLNLQYSEEMKSWMVTLVYSWGKIFDVERQKALNEI